MKPSWKKGVRVWDKGQQKQRLLAGKELGTLVERNKHHLERLEPTEVRLMGHRKES